MIPQAARAVIQGLLGCGWGRRVGTADDMAPCPERADRIVVLHDGPHEHEVRLCARHIEAIEALTGPHADLHGRRLSDDDEDAYAGYVSDCEAAGLVPRSRYQWMSR